MSRLSVFIWYSLSIYLLGEFVHAETKQTLMMVAACGTGLWAHWTFNGRTK